MAARWESSAASRQGYIMDSPRRGMWRDSDPKRFAAAEASKQVYPSFLYQRSSHGDPLLQRNFRDVETPGEEDAPSPRYAPPPRHPSPERWAPDQTPRGRDGVTQHWRGVEEFASPRPGMAPPEQYASPRAAPLYGDQHLRPRVEERERYYEPRGPPPDVQAVHPEPAVEQRPLFIQSKYGVSRGTYVFIWFATRRQENTDVVAHACVRSKPETYGGRFVGIARKLDEKTALKFTGDEAIVVFLFESWEMGKKFCECDKRIQQPDFPPPSGICDILPLPRYYNPENESEYKTFVLSEVLLNEGVNLRDYKEDYVKPFGDFLHENAAQPFVVQSLGYRFHRRLMPINHFPPDRAIMTCHLFHDRYHYQSLRDSARYRELKSIQGTMAWEMTTAFSIAPKACP